MRVTSDFSKFYSPDFHLNVLEVMREWVGNKSLSLSQVIYITSWARN